MQDSGGRQVLTHRVITMLGRQEMDYLDKLGKDALFSTGRKLSYNDILRGLIDFAMEAGISGEKIDSARSLKEKLLHQLVKIEVKKGGN
ncbi:MAG: hypothetical protein PHT50_05095 [Candidatus Omnitrophica bacterium]|nr:hypothetical protein [Candidatus Omnitrophota bacterium]